MGGEQVANLRWDEFPSDQTSGCAACCAESLWLSDECQFYYSRGFASASDLMRRSLPKMKL